jgi:hypothetical protein
MVSMSPRPRHIRTILDHIGAAVIRMEPARLVRVDQDPLARMGTALDRRVLVLVHMDQGEVLVRTGAALDRAGISGITSTGEVRNLTGVALARTYESAHLVRVGAIVLVLTEVALAHIARNRLGRRLVVFQVVPCLQAVPAALDPPRKWDVDTTQAILVLLRNTDDSAQILHLLILRVLDQRAVRLLQTLEAFLPQAAGKREIPTPPAPLKR